MAEFLERKFKFREKEYTLREMNGEEDLAFVSEFTNPLTGKQNMKEIWIRRISRCLVNPKMTTAEVSALPAKELQTLIQAWMLMNEPDPVAFLEN